MSFTITDATMLQLDFEKIKEHKHIVFEATFEYVMRSLDSQRKYYSFFHYIIKEAVTRPTIPSYIVSCFEANARGVSDSQDGMEQLVYVGHRCVKDADPCYFRDTVKALLEINQFEKSHGEGIRTVEANFERLVSMSETERNIVDMKQGIMEYLVEGTMIAAGAEPAIFRHM